MSQSYLEPKEGMYDPRRRFAFTNLLEVPFTFQWNGSPITVPPKDTIELPHHLAWIATKKLVDQIMQDEVHAEELEVRMKKEDPYWRSPKGLALGVPEARKVWEVKILREMKVDEESPQIQVMRAKIREEVERDLKGQNAEAISSIAVPKEEFAALNEETKEALVESPAAPTGVPSLVL